MTKSRRIIDNPSYADLLRQIRALESFEALYRAIPFARKLFPKIDEVFSSFSEVKKQAEILEIPDRFNEIFSKFGWIAYESMNFDIMKKSIARYEFNGIEEAELYLADSYDEDALKFGIMRFSGNIEFRRRIRLANLAKEDYLERRYHACIPLLLSLIDGLVNDVSRSVGFFAESSDMTAWDSMAAHETGLQSLASLMTKKKNKTNEKTITIPYRNGILHGRELAFDNKIVAAKCWATLFAIRDWAAALSDWKKTPKPKKEISWKETFASIIENNRKRKLLEAWKPRDSSTLSYLPNNGIPSELPIGTPERAIAEFIENWCKQCYGLIAESLLYFTDTSKGKRAGLAKEDFSRRVPSSFKIFSVEDRAFAASHVIVDLSFATQEGLLSRRVSVRAIYQEDCNGSLTWNGEKGDWKVVQNSLSEILYAVSL